MLNTIPVTVNCPAKKALKYAYEALLSFEKAQSNYIKENTYTAYAEFKTKWATACLVNIWPLSDSECRMFIMVFDLSAYSHTPKEILQVYPEFIKRFSELLEQDS